MQRNHWAYVGIAPITVVILSYLIQAIEFTLVFPVFRYLLAAHAHYLPLTLSACYLGHIILIPLAGSLTDYFGRRRIILIALAVWAICFFFSAISLYVHSMTFFLITRLLGGSLISYRPLVISVLSDIYPDAFARQRALALFSGCDGVASAFYLFIVGKIFYGVLDPIGMPIFYFLISGVLSLFNLFFIYTNLPETSPSTHAFNRYWAHFSRSFRNIFKTPQFKSRLLLLFFTYSAMMFHVFSKLQLKANLTNITGAFFLKLLSLAIAWSLTSIFVVPRLVRFFSPKRIYFYSFLWMLLLWLITFLYPSAINTFWNATINGILMGTLWPIVLMLGTWRIPHELQGTAQGVYQFLFAISVVSAVSHLNLSLSANVLAYITLGFIALGFAMFGLLRFDSEYASTFKDTI